MPSILLTAAFGVLITAWVGDVGSVVLGGHQLSVPISLPGSWLADGVVAAATVLCLLRVVARPGERGAWALLTTGMAVYFAGDVYSDAVLASLDPAAVPYPSWADAGWLLWYPFLYAGLLLLVRHRITGVRAGLWLDGLTAGAGAAAVAGAMFLRPVLDATGGSTATILVNLAYPVADLALLAVVVLVLNLCGWRPGTSWGLISAAFTLLFAADVVYSLQVAAGTYVPATVLDASWPGVFVLLALAAWRPARPARAAAASPTGVVVPTLFSLAGTVVLFTGAGSLPLVVRIAGLLSVLLATARLLLTLVEARRLAAARLEARTDELTGLGNRRSFVEALRSRSGRPGGGWGVLLLDLDGFKQVNDSLGHGVGDELLRVCGARLQQEIASTGGHLARLGGDEFAVLVEGLDEGTAVAAAHRVREVLVQPVVLAGVRLLVDASIGVSWIREGVRGEGADGGWQEALRQADSAMYAAKRARSGVQVYAQERDDEGRGALSLLADLRAALDAGELQVHYQPQVALPGGVLLSVEALVRWTHPQLGLLLPAAFLPLVDAAGLNRQLTDHVLGVVARDAAAWQAAGTPLAVAVNLSHDDVTDPQLLERIRACLAPHDLDLQGLVLEVTETVIGAHDPSLVQGLQRLHQAGLRLSLDDFGTGHSSLSYLRHLPLDEVKLDRSFLTDLLTDPTAAKVVAGTVALAHALGLSITAEGVEDEATLNAVAELGADVVQGYLLGRPGPATALGPLLAQRSATCRPARPPGHTDRPAAAPATR